MLGEFDVAAHWLTIADSYHRRGDTLNAAGVIGSALREHPNNADLWVGLGNALVLHADGMMTPAAELAFQHAAALAPDARTSVGSGQSGSVRVDISGRRINQKKKTTNKKNT